MNIHMEAAPVAEERFLTPGVMVMLALMAIGLAFGAARFIFGIGKVANLSNQFPWGIWIGVDVATGVALAAGGFLLNATGFDVALEGRQSDHAIFLMRVFDAFVPFVASGIAIWAIAAFPITEESAHQVRLQLEARRGKV